MSRNVKLKGKNMGTSFKRQKHDPIELINGFWPDADISHIKYDPDMTHGEYEIIRQSGGDGTLYFTHQMFREALIRLVIQDTFFKPKTPETWDNIKAIHYTIGPMKHVQVFGMIRLRCSETAKYPGQRERIRIPVISELEYK